MRNESHHHKQTLDNTAAPAAFSSSEWDARCDLAAAYRLAAANGWHDMFGTHFTVRVPAHPDTYLVNPLGRFFEEITASSLLKIDTEGNVLSDSPYGVNAAADKIHGAVLAARSDVGAVMHLHAVAGTAVSIQKGGLLPLSQSAGILMGRVRYYRYGGTELDAQELAHLVASLGDGSVLFMRNHGTLTVGRTIGEAYALMMRVERACQIQIAAQAADEVVSLHQNEIEKLAALGKHIYSPESWSPAARAEWAAFRRKADRDFPDYAS